MAKSLLDTKKLLASAKLSRSLKWDDLIVAAAKEHGLEKDDLEGLIEELEELIEDTTPLDDYEDYYIKSITLENVMVHKFTELTLDKHLNVIGGHTGSGKTAVLRAIECVLENKITGFSNPRQSITLGEDEGSISIELSNGYVVKRVLHRTKTAENYYIVTDPGLEVFKYKVSEIKEIQKVFGFQYLTIEGKKINLNYLQQGNGWFFIGSEFPSSQRAKILGALFGTQDMDIVLKKYIDKVKDLKKDVKKESLEKDVLDEKLKNIKESDSKTKMISDVEKEIESLKLIEDELNILIGLQSELKEAEGKVEKLTKHFEDIKGEDFSSLKKSLKEIEDMNNEISELQKLSKEYKSIAKKGIKLKKQLKIHNEIFMLMNDTLSSFEEVEELQKLSDEYSRLAEKGIGLKDTVKSLNEDLLEIKDDYKNELLSIGICPCCNQKITEDVAEHMANNH